MVLGIKLEIDKKSIKDASKSLRGGVERGSAGRGRRGRGAGIGAAAGAVVGAEAGQEGQAGEKKKKGDKKGNGAFGGALVGGLIGAVVGSLKPIQELLGVVAGILQIFMVPVLVLLKPFLILFLKVGIALMNAFTAPGGETGGQKTKRIGGNIAGILLGIVAVIVAGFVGASALLIAAIALGAFLLGKALFNLVWWIGTKIGEFFSFLFESILLPAFEWLGEKFKQLGQLLVVAWQWLVNGAKIIWGWFVKGFQSILKFGGWIWDMFVAGLSLIGDFGSMIWDLFVTGLKGIADLGTRIWNWIKSSLGSFFGGGGSTSVDDALITNQGQVIKLNPNDNVLAFQDFSQVSNVAGAGSGGANINVTVNGFVGNDQEIAERLAKALNKSSRGSTLQF